MMNQFAIGWLSFVLIVAGSSTYEPMLRTGSSRRSRNCDDINNIYHKDLSAIQNQNNLILQEVQRLTTISNTQQRLYENLEKTLTKDYEEMKNILTSILPEDCSGAKIRGSYRSNIMIKPPGLEPREVRCNQLTSDGGWTVVVSRDPVNTKIATNAMNTLASTAPLHYNYNRRPQNNYPSSSKNIPEPIERFNRTWNDYKIGFGDPEKEYWIGNEVLHVLTADRTWQALVIVEDWAGQKAKALWNKFRVLGEENHYTLQISDFQVAESPAGDGLSYHNNKAFSTFDQDNDHHNSEHCAQNYGGGWWFHQCHLSLLTGASLGPGGKGHHVVHWRPWKGDEALKSAVLMIRPLQN